MSGNTVKINSNSKPNNVLRNGIRSGKKVVVAVDFQPCFVTGGSMGGTPGFLFDGMYHTFDLFKKNKNGVEFNFSSKEISHLTKMVNFSAEFADSYNQAVEMNILFDRSDDIIVTRDLHPQNHKSFQSEGGDWPVHCSNKMRACPLNNVRNETSPALRDFVNTNLQIAQYHLAQGNTNNTVIANNAINNARLALSRENQLTSNNTKNTSQTIGQFLDKITTLNNTLLQLNGSKKNNLRNSIKGSALSWLESKDLTENISILREKLSNNLNDKIVGTNLHFLYSLTDYWNDGIATLTKPNRQTIGLTMDSIGDEIPDIKKIVPRSGFNVNGKRLVSLTKGQFCKFEANSAFNYHMEFRKAVNGKYLPHTLKACKKYSTGAFEHILSDVPKDRPYNLDITICGLVGQVCIYHSVIQGLLMWNHVYKPSYPDVNITFNYSLCGTRFIPGWDNMNNPSNPPLPLALKNVLLYLNEWINVPTKGNSLSERKQKNSVYFIAEVDKPLISFNILDYSGKISATINFNSYTGLFEAKMVRNNGNVNRNNNVNNNNVNNNLQMSYAS